MIQVHQLTKQYRSGSQLVEVLRGVDCAFPEATFTFILGPSGSGKSTLLYLLGGLDQPSSGEITVAGRPLGGLTSRQRDQYRREDVGFIFQSFNLLKNLSALDNALLPYLARGASGELRRQARELLGRVGLGDRLEHRPAQLSGGEQQRVAIARAILKRPRVILADEPTGELDSHTGRAVFEMLRELHREHGSTVVTVTHDERYLTANDRILHLQDGRLAGAGA